MIFDTHKLGLPLRLSADLCVVGAGAGGATAAMVAAEAGLKVVLLEAGEWLTPADMSQREEEMFPRLYWEAGGRATPDRSVRVHQGRGVGGSTIHNINLVKRIPEPILRRWQAAHRLEHLGLDRWAALYQETERLLGVTLIPEDKRNRHNRLLELGCKELGWRGGPLHHNRDGCIGSGFCEIGCAYDAKNNAAKVMVPRAVKAGAQILACCQAVTVEHRGGRVQGVRAVARHPVTGKTVGAVDVATSRVCLSGSATATPAILQRSHVPDPSGRTGTTLSLHPGVAVAGDFDEPVHAWRGIPQSYECTEWLDFEREDGAAVWIAPAFAHPVGTATMIPLEGHREVMQRYAHLAVLSAMVHDRTLGRVGPSGDYGVDIDYWPERADRAELARGLWACAKLLLAAGARRVFVPTREPRVLRPGDDLHPLLALDLQPGDLPLTSVHPMASVPMDDDPTRAAIDSRGRHHHVAGLWVADGSVFPSSIGVPPQLSIYAMGLHVGRAIAAEALSARKESR